MTRNVQTSLEYSLTLWVRGLMAINVGCEFSGRGSIPGVCRSRVLTLGKLANLNQNLNGGLLLN